VFGESPFFRNGEYVKLGCARRDQLTSKLELDQQSASLDFIENLSPVFSYLVIRFSAQGGLNAIRDGKNCINP
jgi:hypothetical protein